MKKIKTEYKGKLEHSIYCPCPECEKCRMALRQLIKNFEEFEEEKDRIQDNLDGLVALIRMNAKKISELEQQIKRTGKK